MFSMYFLFEWLTFDKWLTWFIEQMQSQFLIYFDFKWLRIEHFQKVRQVRMVQSNQRVRQVQWMLVRQLVVVAGRSAVVRLHCVLWLPEKDHLQQPIRSVVPDVWLFATQDTIRLFHNLRLKSCLKIMLSFQRCQNKFYDNHITLLC